MKHPKRPDVQHQSLRGRWRARIRWAFVAWAVVSTSWVTSGFVTRGVPPKCLRDSKRVQVLDSPELLEFRPADPKSAGVIFLCGSGVAAQAYAPLLRPIADRGYPVFIVRLPYRLAPLESHKLEAMARAQRVIGEHPETAAWMLSGHSLGAALACRVARERAGDLAALVLVGTTHPKLDDLSGLSLPVMKISGSRDRIAPLEKVKRNQRLLPLHTRWVLIEGANHSQFGHYGHQFLDGRASISREQQQSRTRQEMLRWLETLPRK